MAAAQLDDMASQTVKVGSKTAGVVVAGTAVTPNIQLDIQRPVKFQLLQRSPAGLSSISSSSFCQPY
ncbi:MAG: hypothetical protein KC594_09335 [Nitrospira sp.]|nr:hypothetical protein [Nitrospira sp.]